MRLTDQQQSLILKVIQEILSHRPFEVYLYGSRINENLKGGDIDLFCLSSNPWPSEDLKKEFQILAALKADRALGERKINFSLITQHEKATDPFWQVVTETELLGEVLN